MRRLALNFVVLLYRLLRVGVRWLLLIVVEVIRQQFLVSGELPILATALASSLRGESLQLNGHHRTAKQSSQMRDLPTQTRRCSEVHHTNNR